MKKKIYLKPWLGIKYHINIKKKIKYFQQDNIVRGLRVKKWFKEFKIPAWNQIRNEFKKEKDFVYTVFP